MSLCEKNRNYLQILIGCCISLSHSALAAGIQPNQIDIPPQLMPELKKHPTHNGPNGVPSGSITSPNALGSLKNGIFFGVSSVPTMAIVDAKINSSTATLFGLSFGNAAKNIGLTLGITDTSLFSHLSFMSQASLSLRVNRYINTNTALAVGAVNLVGSKQYKTLPSSFYLTLTHVLQTPVPISASFGMGNGIFNPLDNPKQHHSSLLYPFVSIGFGLAPHFSFVTDWASNRLSIGTAYTPHLNPYWSISINLNLLNITGTLPAHEKPGDLSLSILLWHAMAQ